MKYLLIAFLLIPFSLKSQDLNQNIISSSGAYFTSIVSLSWTIGEPVIESFTNSGIILTQGYQQGNHSVKTGTSVKEFSKYYMVYPNPVTDILTIKSNSDNFHYQLFNNSGQIIEQKIIMNMFENIDFSVYPNGIYYLIINNKEIHKLIKTKSH